MTKLLVKSLLAVVCACAYNTASGQESLNKTITPVEVIRETFSDNARQWPAYNGAEAVLGLQDGQYIHKSISRELLIPKSAGTDIRPKAAYFKLRVQAKLMEGTGFYGIVWGVQNKDNYYTFLIDDAGNYKIEENKAGVLAALITGKSPKINTGAGALNILGVQTSTGVLGYNVSYLVNGSNILMLTVADQAVYDAARKAKEAAGTSTFFSTEDMNAMTAGALQPKGAGLGLLTRPGVTVAYDNMQLLTMPNQGDIVMAKNDWKWDMSDALYLKKTILAEDEKRRNDYDAFRAKTATEARDRAQKDIAALTTAQRTPPGGGGKTFTPELAAVVWLRDILFQIDNSSPFGFYYEKEEASKTSTTTEYRLQHNLPGINAGPAAATVEERKSATLFVPLGDKLSEADARTLYGQQMVNLCAAAGATTCQYVDPKKDDAELHMIGVHTGGKSFLSGRRTTAVVLPSKNADGTWRLRIYMKAE